MQNFVGMRVKQARKHAKLTQVELAKAIDTSQGAISDLENGRNESSTNLVQMAKVMGVNPTWLATGEGEMLDQPAPYQLDRRGLGNVEPVDMSKMKLKKAPILNWVQAGIPNIIGDNTWEEWEFYFDDNYGENVYWLHIKGDSMTPIFEEGDLILIDMDRHPRAGDYVIAIVDGDNEATFKKYKPCGYDEKLGCEYCQLIALNNFYPPYDSRYTRINIIGTVVEFKKKFV